MLFDTPSYFNHSFPVPQYLGAKHTHLTWINKFIPSRVTTALDAFAGSQSMAFLFKQLGFQTITNDFLNFNNQIGLALIENNDNRLTNDDINLLFSPATNKKDFQLIENTFTNIFFQQNEAAFLDSVWPKIHIVILNHVVKILFCK